MTEIIIKWMIVTGSFIEPAGCRDWRSDSQI